MNYLIISNTYEPFYTNWFNAENNFNADDGMIVFDLLSGKHTINGTDWIETKQDHL